jgi:hypothetical protein
MCRPDVARGTPPVSLGVMAVVGSSQDRAACSLCCHAAEFGWWGLGVRGTHCRGCGDSWTGTCGGSHCLLSFHFRWEPRRRPVSRPVPVEARPLSDRR